MASQELAPGIVRIVFNGMLSGTPWAAVMHSQDVSFSGAHVSQAALDATAAGWRAAWVANFIPRQSATDITLGTVTAQDLGFLDGGLGTAAGTTAGGRANPSLPANCAMCISWRVAMHYKGGHGRTYIAGKTTADVTGATSWATAELTAMTTAATNFISAVGVSFGSRPSQFVILRREMAKEILKPPVPLLVTGAVIDTRIDSMRRRLGKDR